MTDIQLEIKYKTEIRKFYPSDPASIFFYWKGRVALYALLKSIGIKNGDEVILSGLTCVVVPNAIIYLGAKPIYSDVDIHTCNPSFESIREKVTPDTKAIVLQNTFGLSSCIKEIVNFAQGKGIFTIEDCTHGFGGNYEGQPNGSYADAAIFSTQWNKPFSTGIGGFCIVNNKNLLSGLNMVNKDLIRPSCTENMMLSSLVSLRSGLVSQNTYWFFRNLYRKLSRAGIVIGSSQGDELSGVKMPDGYFKAASSVQLQLGQKNIKKLKEHLVKRKENAAAYTDFLILNNKMHVDRSLFDDHSFLIYPLLVKDRKRFMINAEKARIEIGDWFVSPLHPVLNNFSNWFLNESSVPNAVRLSTHLVNLPSMEKEVGRIIDFLDKNLDEII